MFTQSNHDLSEHPTTLVLLDPTSDDGEVALDLLSDADDHISLAVLLSGRTSSALREYAAAESLALADAGWFYLDQVAERLAGPARLVETVVAAGPDPAAELALLASEGRVGRIVLPPSILRLDAAAVQRLTNAVADVPVSVAALVTA